WFPLPQKHVFELPYQASRLFRRANGRAKLLLCPFFVCNHSSAEPQLRPTIYQMASRLKQSKVHSKSFNTATRATFSLYRFPLSGRSRLLPFPLVCLRLWGVDPPRPAPPAEPSHGVAQRIDLASFGFVDDLDGNKFNAEPGAGKCQQDLR